MSRTQHDQAHKALTSKAIQEAYLSMEDAHRLYRRARDEGEQAVNADRPEAIFQDAVMTFYELLRPYLKEEAQLEAYWNGKIPPYPNQFHRSIDQAIRYYDDNGVGVYQIQQHVNQSQVNQQVLTDGGSDMPQSPKQWHQILRLPNTSRLVSLDRQHSECYFRELRFAVMGLRELDTWQATVITERTQGDGFMAGETNTSQRREYQPPQKITQAKRMLTDAANKLGTLPEYKMKDSRDAKFEYSDLLEGGSDGNA